LAAFPISYCFQRAAVGLILVQCRYLGEDYSGRPGNFLGHAVVAADSDLNGLRPIELWRSTLWADRPAGAELPEATELTPGRGSEPEAVLDRLHAQGERGYRLLSDLVDATLANLDGTASQVVLVADRAETVAAWIAAISYSLPLATALELSFITYTADPDRARQRLVGTFADASSVVPVDAQVFRLDDPGEVDTAEVDIAEVDIAEVDTAEVDIAEVDIAEVDTGGRPAGAAPSRYAATVTAAWRRRDLAAIDTLCELISLVGGTDGGAPDAAAAPAVPSREERDAIAALAALSYGEPVPGTEAAAAARIVRRHGERLPASLLTALAAQPADRLGLDLLGALSQLGMLSPAQRQAITPLMAQAVRKTTDLDDLAALLTLARAGDLPVDPAALRAATVHAVARGGDLDAAYDALAGDEQRAALLDGVVEGLAHADGPRLRAVLTPAACDRLLGRDWSRAPDVGGYVLVSHGQRHPAHRLNVTQALADLGDRRLLSAEAVNHAVGRVWRGTEPAVADCLRLVGLLSDTGVRRDGVLDLMRRAFAAGDIRGAQEVELAKRLLAVVNRGPAAADADTVLALHEIIKGQLSAGCVRLDRTLAHANPEVVKEAAKYAYDQFSRAKPQTQADVIAKLPPRSRLRQELVRRLVKSAKDVDLAEVAARLVLSAQPDETLSERTRKLTRRPLRRTEIRTALGARNRRLVKGFDDLVARTRRPGLLGRLIHRDGHG
jgi:hypothetical protein